MLSKHLEALGDRDGDKIAVTSSLPGKMSIWSSQELSANRDEGFSSPCWTSPILISSLYVFNKHCSV